MGPINSLCRNLQLEDANQGKNFFAHFAENAEFAVEHSLLGYEKRKIKV